MPCLADCIADYDFGPAKCLGLGGHTAEYSTMDEDDFCAKHAEDDDKHLTPPASCCKPAGDADAGTANDVCK